MSWHALSTDCIILSTLTYNILYCLMTFLSWIQHKALYAMPSHLCDMRNYALQTVINDYKTLILTGKYNKQLWVKELIVYSVFLLILLITVQVHINFWVYCWISNNTDKKLDQDHQAHSTYCRSSGIWMTIAFLCFQIQSEYIWRGLDNITIHPNYQE